MTSGRKTATEPLQPSHLFQEARQPLAAAVSSAAPATATAWTPPL
eukprot:CAMPEP_0180651926 /NCGR_PEP_ID=MMETSP1037_2-20121125/53187_1 /TAXON_ID=632150 /ORGANISM="Azadinium spinosum, Strain 3D9" /LENGTH=44 /DNA_ID= /DNA_START= /DNA_END= /DNA_ORIENTATION=